MPTGPADKQMSDVGWGTSGALEGSCLSGRMETTVPLMVPTGMQSQGGYVSRVDFKMLAAKK